MVLMSFLSGSWLLLVVWGLIAGPALMLFVALDRQRHDFGLAYIVR